jgi:transposase
LTVLYRATDRLSRGGAAVENLAHSASFHSRDKNAPSKPGIKQFNAAGPSGLIDRKAPGQPSRLNARHRTALSAVIESGPIPAVHGVVRWRIIDLCQWLWDEFEVRIANQTLSRELRAMGYRKLSARPRHHAQAEGAVALFKRTSPPCWTRSGKSGASTLPT